MAETLVGQQLHRRVVVIYVLNLLHRTGRLGRTSPASGSSGCSRIPVVWMPTIGRSASAAVQLRGKQRRTGVVAYGNHLANVRRQFDPRHGFDVIAESLPV